MFITEAGGRGVGVADQNACQRGSPPPPWTHWESEAERKGGLGVPFRVSAVQQGLSWSWSVVWNYATAFVQPTNFGHWKGLQHSKSQKQVTRACWSFRGLGVASRTGLVLPPPHLQSESCWRMDVHTSTAHWAFRLGPEHAACHCCYGYKDINPLRCQSPGEFAIQEAI